MTPRANSVWFRAMTTAVALVVAVFGVIAACYLQTASPTRPTVQAAFGQVVLATTVSVAPALQDASYPPGCGPDGSGANGGKGGNGGWFGRPGESGQAAQNGHCGKNGANGTSRATPLVSVLIAVLALGVGLFLVIRKRSRNNRAARANTSG
jgi:hypothetical protein